MPFDGSGNFTRVMNWVSDALANIKIVATRHDSEDDNFAAGLSQCLTKDGQTQPTANIPMNGKKLTNLGAPTTGTDAVTKTYADTADALAMPKAGGTFTGAVVYPASTTSITPINVPAGAAPSAPAHGALWNTTVAWFTRITGVTYTLAMLEAAQTWTLDQIFSARLAIKGGVFGTNSRSGITNGGDLTLAGSFFLGLNTYFDTVAAAFKSSVTGWGGLIQIDSSTGIVTMYRSTASAAANAAQTLAAWLTSDPTNGLTLAGPAGLFKYNAGNVLIDNIDRLGIAAGFGVTAATSDGTKSSGTYTPTPAANNFRSITNGGAFNLAADATANTCWTLALLITNNGSAGAITTAGQGWTKIDGDAFTTTNLATFLCLITKIGSIKTLTVTQVV